MTDMKIAPQIAAVSGAAQMNVNDYICKLVAAKVAASAESFDAYQVAMLTLEVQTTMANFGMTATAPAPVVAASPAVAEITPAPISEKRRALLPNPKADLSPEEREERIRASVTEAKVYCLECGQSHQMLKRHLGETHDLTPGEYRARWGLTDEHPLVAPAYSARKAKTAKESGFGKYERM